MKCTVGLSAFLLLLTAIPCRSGAGESPLEIGLKPFFTIDGYIELNNDDLNYDVFPAAPIGPGPYFPVSYNRIEKVGTAAAGLMVEIPNLYSSLSIGSPWTDPDGIPTPFLDLTLGARFKGLIFYGGILRDLERAGEYQLADADYFGLSYSWNFSRMSWENGIQYKETFFKVDNQRYELYDLNFTSRLVFHINTFHPYIYMAVDKWNQLDNPTYSLGMGLTIGVGGVNNCRTPRQVVHLTDNGVVYKPNIYLYPKHICRLKVEVAPNDHITVSIPDYGDGWNVLAYPDGTIPGTDGFLFYEAIVDYHLPDYGWCLKSDGVMPFLTSILDQYGFNNREIKDFVDYWNTNIPRGSDYINVYPLGQPVLEKICPLRIFPEPDNIIRLWLVFEPTDRFIELKEPLIESVQRTGFTVTEWGGLIKE